MNIDEANSKKGELHAVDKILFDNHPSPVWEAMMKLHRSHVNSTTPCFGPLLYWWIRAIGACNVIEIGVAQGYTSWFMASAIKDNNVRYGCNGKYVAIDIADKRPLFQPMIDDGLPIEVITNESIKYLETQKMFAPGTLDLAFVDGWHNDKYVRREMELIYPLLKNKGEGYAFLHDIYGYCERIYDEIVKNPNYKWEHIRLMNNYGLGILRKMENYDYTKIYWPEGDQPEAQGFIR